MHAIRAAHAFDGTQFLPNGATVLVDEGRIVGVETRRVDVPDGVEVTEDAGTVLPGLIDCHTRLRHHRSAGPQRPRKVLVRGTPVDVP